MGGIKMELASTKLELSDALAEVNKLKEQFRWRKYPEEKPEIGHTVLTLTYGGSFVIGSLDIIKEWSHTCIVTHWIPIPKLEVE